MYRRGGRSGSVLVLLVLLALTIVAIDYREGRTGPIARLQQQAIAAFGPLQQAVATTAKPLTGGIQTLTRALHAGRRNQQLSAEVSTLRVQVARAQALAAQNAQLRSTLHVVQSCSCQTLGATVVAGSGSNFESMITIDAGSRVGVKVGDPVLASGGLVGRVAQVSAAYATATLLQDPSSAVAARIPGAKVLAIVHGQGSQVLSVTLLNPTAPVRAGQTVVTEGYAGEAFPPGLPMGTITSVGPLRGGLTRQVLMRPLINAGQLGAVSVIVSPVAG